VKIYKVTYTDIFILLIYSEIEVRQANAKEHVAVDHLTSILSSREEISQPRFEPPTSSLGFGYLSTIIQ
jgi:hypothetical protein